MTPLPLTPCPHCTSRWCGLICRFYGKKRLGVLRVRVPLGAISAPIAQWIERPAGRLAQRESQSGLSTNPANTTKAAARLIATVLSLALAGPALADKQEKPQPDRAKCESRCIDWNQKREWKKREPRPNLSTPTQMLKDLMDKLREMMAEEAE